MNYIAKITVQCTVYIHMSTNSCIYYNKKKYLLQLTVYFYTINILKNMKTMNFLIRSIILLVALLTYFAILNYYDTSDISAWASAVYCEGVQSSTLDNNFFKIEEIKTNTWHVLFNNVGVKYEIRQCQTGADINTSLFELREIGPNYAGLFNPEFLWKMIDVDVVKCWDANNQGYEKQKDGSIRLLGSADPNSVFIRRHHNNIVDAAMEHFNCIQRGEFHPNAENVINPNSHGRGTALAAVPLSAPSNICGPNTGPTAVTGVYASVKEQVTSKNVFSKPQVKDEYSNLKTNDSTSISMAIYSGKGTINSANGQVVGNNKTIHHTQSSTSGSSHSSSSLEDDEPCRHVTKTQREVRSPLDQFLIRDLLIIIMPLLANLYISYTNMALYLTIATLVIIIVYLLAANYEKIQTSYWYITIESIYATLYSIVINQINAIKGQNFFPFIYCLFVFILTNNLIGMVPYSFAPTSHFILTFFISFTIVFGSAILGFILHSLKFFSLLVPNGCPLGLLPLLVLIESISYLARNVSLGLRLAANILSGHMLLNILSEFTYKIMDTNIVYFFVGILPLMFIGAFSALEIGIAFIQSQVFVVLSSSYTKDSLELH